MFKTWSTERIIFLAIGLLMIIGVSIWIYLESKPRHTPGEAITDLGRGHVPMGTQIFYNSNPPTSGTHYEIWTRAGIFDTPLDDRNLVHSLEHGYVIMSYNCDLQSPLIAQVNEASNSARMATDSASLSEPFRGNDCNNLKTNLTQLFEEKGKRKLIVLPRPDLKNQIVLSAWAHLQRFDSFDKKSISDFIDAYRDQGPEKTME